MATVALDCVVIGNEARSNEYLAGQFLCGVDNLRVTADATVTSLVLKSFDVSISRAGVVAVDLTVKPATQFAASVQGVGAVQASLARTVSLSASVAGVGSIQAQQDPLRGFAVSVSGVGTVSPTLVVLLLVKFDASVAGVASVQTTTLGIIKDLTVQIGRGPICGEHLCGTFLCDSGCAANVIVQDVIWRSLAALIQGQADLRVALNKTFQLAAAISGQATVKAAINLGWLVPTEPLDWILIPTTPRDDPWILIPTTPSLGILVATTPGTETLAPTEEEDWILVPTTERTM